MLDKDLIKKNFKKGLVSYEDNAVIQKKMASCLAYLIPKRKYDKVLEIGSYNGFLTRELIKKIDFDSYFALDIVDSFDYIKNLSSKISFINCDIEEFSTQEKFDLIVANASLQWCNDFEKTINKLKSFLNDNGILALSIFASDNFVEIKESFGIGLDYLNEDEIKRIFPNCLIENKKDVLKFNGSRELLKHLKLTGVNSIKKNGFKYRELKEKLKILEEKFDNKLTYSSVYVVFEKNNLKNLC